MCVNREHNGRQEQPLGTPHAINPLVTDPLCLVYVWQKFRFKKKEGIIEKISYEHRTYESVDDRSHS